MRSILCTTAATALMLGTVALAILTPATNENRRPMAFLILGAGLFAPAALLVAAGQPNRV